MENIWQKCRSIANWRRFGNCFADKANVRIITRILGERVTKRFPNRPQFVANCLSNALINCQIFPNCLPVSYFWGKLGEQWQSVNVHLANPANSSTQFGGDFVSTATVWEFRDNKTGLSTLAILQIFYKHSASFPKPSLLSPHFLRVRWTFSWRFGNVHSSRDYSEILTFHPQSTNSCWFP